MGCQTEGQVLLIPVENRPRVVCEVESEKGPVGSHRGKGKLGRKGFIRIIYYLSIYLSIYHLSMYLYFF
jgi:hypothetical protein